MRNGNDVSLVDGLCWPSLWRVHRERLMDGLAVVILEVVFENATEMSFAEDDDPVQTLPPDAPIESLRVWILPWTVRRDQHLVDSHILHALPEPPSVDYLSVA